MRTCRVVAIALLASASSHAFGANHHSREDAIYQALADADLSRADSLSQAWLRDADEGEALSVRLAVIAAKNELSKPAGDALRLQIDEAQRKSNDTTLNALFDAHRQIETGKRAVAASAALALLQSDESLSVAQRTEFQAVLGCAAQISPGDDTAQRNAADALATLHTQPGLRSRYREFQVHYCIGNAFARVGRETEAIDAFERAANVAAASFGADDSLRLMADDRHASELEQLGRVREELDLRASTLQRARRRYGGEHLQTAEAEAGLAACLQQLGDLAQSRAHYEAAEKIVTHNSSDVANLRLRVTANFANVLQEAGDEAAALTRYQAALKLAQAIPGTERSQGVILTNTGNTEFRLRHYDKAADDFRRGLALRESVDGTQSPGLAFSLEGLGSTALVEHRYAQAQEYFQRALNLREAVSQKDRPQHVQLLTLRFGLAMAKWGMGDSDGAFALAQECAESAQRLMSGIAANLPERQRVKLHTQLPPATALVVTLAAQRGDRASIERAWQLVAQERGSIARMQARRMAQARADSNPSLHAAWQAWRDASTATADAWLTSDSVAHIDALRSAADDAERAFWDRLGGNPAADEDRPLSVSALAHALPPSGVLVAMAEGVNADPGWPLIAGGAHVPERWYVFRVSDDDALGLIDIGPIEALSALTREWHVGLSSPSSNLVDVNRHGADLRAALFDPIKVLDQPRHVFFVPEGELYRLSFAALPIGEGYAVEKGLSVHTMSNESELLMPAREISGTTVLAGAPLWSSASTMHASRASCPGADGNAFAPLPYAARELRDLDTLLAHDGADVKLLIGAQATKENVVASLAGARVIHLATHGFSLEQTCGHADSARSMSIASDTLPTDDHPQLSGLAFSSAHAAGAHASAIISGDEFASLDLSHAEWVALSACDSGLGPNERGEGVFGMRRAIRMAGARTVVMSLWNVDDASTSQLMHSLYESRFLQHRDVPDSIARAMNDVLQSRRAAGLSDHPYYWAAFVSEGGWR